MKVGIGQITSSILTAIPKKFSSLLFINPCTTLLAPCSLPGYSVWSAEPLRRRVPIHCYTVKYYFKPVVLKYRPSLRGPCVKKKNSAFYSMAWAIRLINNLWYRKCQNILNIYREFATVFWKRVFHKLVQNHFPKILCAFSNFLKIVQKFTKNFPQNTSFIKSILPSFITFCSFQRIWDNFSQHAFSVLLSSWSIGQDGAILPDNHAANQILRKQSRMSSQTTMNQI